MTGLTHIDRVVVHKNLISEAFTFLNRAGEKGVEGIALFAGYEHNSTFHIKKVIIPKQLSYILEQGLMYSVDGEELHRINVWLYENNMKLIAQIHSHPREAFHSVTDDRYPIVDTYGGISIVVPDFATGPIELTDWAIYRLSKRKNWKRLNMKKTNKLFEVL